MNTYTFKKTFDQTRDTYMKVGEFNKMLNRMDVDMNIQSPTRWNKQNELAYLHSLFSGHYVNPIQIADVKECYKNATDEKDKAYFKKWMDENVGYLVIDGNNRKNTLEKFFNSQLPFSYNGAPLCYDGAVFEQGKTYDELSDSIKQFIDDNILVSTVFLNNLSKSQMHVGFLSTNSGVDLNEGEWLNGVLCDASDAIRDLEAFVINNKHIPHNVVKFEHRQREMSWYLIRLLMIYMNAKNFSRAKFDVIKPLYESNMSVLNREIPKLCEMFKEFCEEVLKPYPKNKLKKVQIFDLLHYYNQAVKNGPVDGREIVRTFMSTVNKLMPVNPKAPTDSEKRYVIKSGTHNVSFDQLYNNMFNLEYAQLRFKAYGKYIPEFKEAYKLLNVKVSNTTDDEDEA